MKEFRGKDLDFIKDCIEGTPEISTVKVNPGETNGPKRERVTGMPNEDKEPGEGAIYYDIRFYVNIPESGEEVRMIINVEGQKSFYPGYQIVTRGIFYAASVNALLSCHDLDLSCCHEIARIAVMECFL